MKVYLVTGNSEKVKSAEKAFEDTNIELRQLRTSVPEIQASTSLKVARHTVEQICKQYNAPVIREDHSVYLNAIPGFPGPFMSYFNKNIPAKKLLKLLENFDDRTGYFEIGTVLGLPNGEINEYEFRVPIKISKELKGNKRNWNQVLMLKEESKTFAESCSESRISIWNQNFRKIAEELDSS